MTTTAAGLWLISSGGVQMDLVCERQAPRRIRPALVKFCNEHRGLGVFCKAGGGIVLLLLEFLLSTPRTRD